jgi:hypothetical protein
VIGEHAGDECERRDCRDRPERARFDRRCGGRSRVEPDAAEEIVEHQPGVGDVVQAVLGIALEAAPQQEAERRRRPRRERRPVDLRLEHSRERVGDVGPANSERPVSISCSSTPKAQMSTRLSTAPPRACSGAM